ncbi:MAG: hypothetical protein Q4C45_03910 [Oscillospiraceae bacterium]|nr:hypothetical protein [Oscillospiraceae bacterium]
MQKVQCYECGKRYDFDEDDFCPKCGAFNQPRRSTRIGADGSVIRVDGINERNHKNSFVHEELHEENRERKAAGLSKGVKRTSRTAAGPAAARPAQTAYQKQTGKRQKSSLVNAIVWIIFAIIAVNILGNLLFLFV